MIATNQSRPNRCIASVLIAMGFLAINSISITSADSPVVQASATSQNAEPQTKPSRVDRPKDQTFTVTQKIYESDHKKPSAHHRLLFDAGVAYDLPQIQTRILTVYDPAGKRVTLLDTETKRQTIINTDELVQFSAGVRATATTDQQRERLGLLAQIGPSDLHHGYSIKFPGVQYDVSSRIPAHRWMANDFGRFSDLASRLNLLWRRGVPPFARMTMGQKLAAVGHLPSETILTIDRGDGRQQYKSTAIVGVLSELDRSKIDDVRGMMKLFAEVPWKEFAGQ